LLWTLNTFMNTLISRASLSGVRVAHGLDPDDAAVGRRHDGARPARTWRGGSRKNWTRKATASHSGIDQATPASHTTAAATATATAMKGQPSRASHG